MTEERGTVILSTAMKLTGSQAQAEDLTQTVFERMVGGSDPRARESDR